MTQAPEPRFIHRRFMLKLLTWVGKRTSSNPEAYSYLGESIRDWSQQEELARRIADAGWGRVAWRDLAGGAVALHRAHRTG